MYKLLTSSKIGSYKRKDNLDDYLLGKKNLYIYLSVKYITDVFWN